MKKLVFGVLVFAIPAIAGDSKPVYRVVNLSQNDVAISCKTGLQPLVDTKTDGTYIIVTCE